MQLNFQHVIEKSPVLKSLLERASLNCFQVMDRDGYILYVNESFTQQFGYDNNDILGKHCRVLFTEEDQKGMMPEMEIENVRQHGHGEDRNYLVDKNNKCIWVSGESIWVHDENGNQFILKILQNIHEQKLLEKFLKESQEFSESVVRSITDALLVIDGNGKILKANNAFYNLYQINSDTIEGEHLSKAKSSFLSSDRLLKKIAEVISTRTTQQIDLECKDPTGCVKNYLVNIIFMDAKLTDPKVLLLISDVTDKVQLERQREDLVDFVIHELKHPLANITLSNKLLRDAIEEKDNKLIEEYLDRIKSSTTRLNSLTRELHDVSRAGGGHLTFNKYAFNFEELVKEVIDSVQLSANTHLVKKEGEANMEVYGDKNLLYRALHNYLNNAIKYSPQADRVELKLMVESGNIIVSITDFGEGIPADKVPLVYNRYYRADTGIKSDGLGLGLFLCKQIITGHNGRVWITSKVNEGSTFSFSIPYKA